MTARKTLFIAALMLFAFASTSCQTEQDLPPIISTSTPVAMTSAPKVSAAPTPSPTPTPIPTPTPPPGEAYKCTVNEMNVRSEPTQDDNDNVITVIGYEDKLWLVEEGHEFSEIELEDGTKGYCFSDFIAPEDAVLYGYIPADTGQKYDLSDSSPVYNSDGSPTIVKNELVDLRLFLPDAEYDLLFNTDTNILGEPLYGRSVPMLQRDTVDKLMEAYDIFKADGYTLIINDAYRPLRVQRRLFDEVQNSSWIANPDTTGSNHNRGCAVDITLRDDDTGEIIDTPTPMHTFTELSSRESDDWTQEQRDIVDYMTEVMDDCGFDGITSEWWHYADTNSKGFMTTDIDLSRIRMHTKEDVLALIGE